MEMLDALAQVPSYKVIATAGFLNIKELVNLKPSNLEIQGYTHQDGSVDCLGFSSGDFAMHSFT